MILYRPVGLQELELIYDNDMKVFPARLPQQPIFYPVLDLEYARQVASDWNVKNGQFAGYVTQFQVEDQYIDKFETHMVGDSQWQEFWIPAEEMEEFNRHITGHIKVLEAYFGDEFQGFVPEKFGLQGKNAVEQFTLLANSYIYQRMDFYLELKRNHKAIFLNYPFWQKYEFKNQGLKEKVLQAIKEAWLTSFPKVPLPLPPAAPPETPPVGQTDADRSSIADVVDEDIAPEEEIDSDSWVNPVREDTPLIKPTGSFSSINPVREATAPEEQRDPGSDSVHEDTAPIKQADPHARFVVKPVREEARSVEPTVSHFSLGVELGLRGKYEEAIEEFSQAVKEDPDHVVAQTSLGVAFHRLGEDDRALSCYEATLRIDPTYAEAHYFRANILYSQENIREAIAGYTIAIGLEPELIAAHQKPAPQDRLTDYSPSPAEMYWIARPAHRILDLNKSLEADPGQASLFKERAAQYSRLRNYVQAIADYSSYLTIQPDDASVLHLRGSAYEQIGQLNRALEDYQRAIAIDPQLSNVYINRGVTLGKMGNFRQSIASFTEAIRLAPTSPDSYFNRGTAYLQQGDFERAIDDFSTVIRLSPGDEEAYYWRGISNEATGRQREAIADYRQFLAISQDPQARDEIEQKLRQWNEGNRNSLSSPNVAPDKRQKTDQIELEKPGRDLDLYDLLTALGERALSSAWQGSGVNCHGETAEELSSFTDYNRPIPGPDMLRIAYGISQTIDGDFTAFDPGATYHWLLLRAWGGRGFYIEINDPRSEERLRAHFPALEEVEGASAPYKSLFIRI